MSIATFSLPIDIPWQRIAFSQDMIDKVACDRELPLRWRSSVAIFEYEPPEDQQRIDGFKISYLKVACTITGYQASGKEIRIRERLARAGWTEKEMEENLTDTIDAYHACYGAMLEVVVAPPSSDEVRLEDYPYFADFDPKKRELYELVTDTGEVMSRTLEDVNVRLGQTTLQSHEIRDTTTVGAELSGSIGLASGTASAAYESRTTDLSQRATENIRTIDSARENRETLSHTTQLSQMYHQLNSYHLGTNRAAFFVLPRPHVVQSTDPAGTPLTFVDGPRQLEGIQEFMLVVVRPKSQEGICVEAYLETAHRVRLTNSDGSTDRLWTIEKMTAEGGVTNQIRHPGGAGLIEVQTRRKHSQQFPMPKGYVVDLTKGDVVTPGVHVTASNPVGSGVNFDWDITQDHVILNAEVINKDYWIGPLWKAPPPDHASLELTATIFLELV